MAVLPSGLRPTPPLMRVVWDFLEEVLADRRVEPTLRSPRAEEPEVSKQLGVPSERSQLLWVSAEADRTLYTSPDSSSASTHRRCAELVVR